MERVRILFKNGQWAEFICDKTTVRSANNELMGLTYEGVGRHAVQPLYVRLDDISAVLTEIVPDDADDAAAPPQEP